MRSKRVWPGRDEKILTAWNGLMIAAFAQAGAVFGDDTIREAAAGAADFMLRAHAHARRPPVPHGAPTAPPKLNGYLEDYAFLADALVTLYEATFEPKWLRAAAELADVMLKHFADPNGPGFFFTADDHEQLIARTKDLHDGSTPSGNAMAVTVLLAAGEAARPPRLRCEGGGDAARLPRDDGRAPGGLGADAHRARLLPRADAGDRGGRDGRQSGDAAGARGDPSGVPAEPGARVPRPGDRRSARLHPAAEGQARMDGAVTVYVCENFACQAPLVGAEAVERFFGERGAS